MVYMVTFTINIPPLLLYIPYMDPMGFMDKKSIQQAWLTQIYSYVIGSVATNKNTPGEFIHQATRLSVCGQPQFVDILLVLQGLWAMYFHHWHHQATNLSWFLLILEETMGKSWRNQVYAVKFEAHSFLFFWLVKGWVFRCGIDFFSLRGWIPHETVSCIMFD
jgi:hypothetical protein